MSKKSYLCLTMTSIIFFSFGVLASTDTTDTPITKVTVYKQKARITRVSNQIHTSGYQSVIFKNLPIRLTPSSLKASSSNEHIIVLGLSHKEVNHIESPKKKISDLVKIIDSLQNIKLREMNDRLEGFTSQKKFLSEFTLNTSENIQVTKREGNIDVSQWDKAFSFLGTNYLNINDSIRKVEREITLLNRELDKYRSDYRGLQNPSSKKTYEVTVDIQVKNPGETEIALEYLVPDASWKPIYNARLNSENNDIEITCLADIKQQTGEDWTNIELTLSTANPTEGVSPGMLSPWYIGREINQQLFSNQNGKIIGRLTDRESGEPIYGASVKIAGTSFGAMTDFDGQYLVKNLQPGKYELIVSHIDYNTTKIIDIIVSNDRSTVQNQSLAKKVTNLDNVITVMAEYDILNKYNISSDKTFVHQPVTTVDELLSQVSGVITNSQGEVFIRGGRAFELSYIADGVPFGDPLGGLGQSGNSLSLVEGIELNKTSFTTTFLINRKETIKSGGDASRTSIATYNLSGKINRISRPKIKRGVYRLAEIKNQNEAPLLPGIVNIFVDSDYMGRAVLTDIIVPEQTFELPFGIDDRIKVTKEIKSYNKSWKGSKITIEQTLEIQLTNNSADSIEVTIEEPLPLSLDDKVKVKFGTISPKVTKQSDNGIAQWKLTLLPQDCQTIQIPFQVKFPKDLYIKGL